MKQVTINEDQKLYVITAGSGYSCLGFDVCLARTQAYAAAMGEQLAIQPAYGTLEAYELYRQIEQRFCQHPAHLSTFFEPGTPAEVQRILESARLSGDRLRLFYGDQDTGQDWGETSDTMGRIGRSMGPIRTLLIVANRRSYGGPAILTRCIVRIATTTAPHRVLYQHPTYTKAAA